MSDFPQFIILQAMLCKTDEAGTDFSELEIKKIVRSPFGDGTGEI